MDIFECTRKCDSGFYAMSSGRKVCYSAEQGATDCAEFGDGKIYNLIDDESQMIQCIDTCQ